MTGELRSTNEGGTAMSTEWVSLMTELGRDFATRAEVHDRDGSFVAENYATLRAHGAFGAGVPAELGGGGAPHATLAAMVRELARHCGSTALAFSMHSHVIATMAYSWRAGNPAVEPILRRVAAEKLVLITSGGSDWLNGSGKLERAEGGFRMNGRKIFSSGAPAGDLLMTTGIFDDPNDGPTVYQFAVSLGAEGVKILDTWRTLGMRGTGSHDVELKDLFLPDAVMQGVRRPAGKWHPFLHVAALCALPVVFSAYLGVAEAARALALEIAARRKDDPLVAVVAGELENHIVAAQLALESMLALTATQKPGPETTNAMCIRRTLVGKAVLAAVDKALELAGGAGFYRSAGIERCFRDVQGARYHPVPEKAQARMTGRFLFGLGLDG
jgi:alkylation response protein AidB-like acyl-CoA dehydrogenase